MGVIDLSKATILVDLSKYQDSNVRVFAGRDRGAEVRKAEKLDALDHGLAKIRVHVPPDTFAVNSSFFLAMFGPSIRSLGEAEFRRKYEFSGKDIRNTVDSGIQDALHVGTSI